ncbi:hypothetical protein [Parvularcula sp. IMCC14364]|uniref:hypothetical protein n=1 Tax=Parvularcula sp. IMCC14364 TaxID=3067902 RepID=UPI0027425DEC|nr:hypothetical protein [Parvularcula sp. IMCC14364]
MTIITALCESDKIWLGENTAVTVGDAILVDGTSKWSAFGDWYLGGAGDSVQIDILRLNSDDLSKPDMDARKIAQTIRDIFKEHDIAAKDEEDASARYGISCILAHKNGRVFDLDPSLAISPIPEGKLWASGSGRDYALGADAALQGLSLSAEERMNRATNAAIACDVNCPGEARVFLLGDERPGPSS